MSKPFSDLLRQYIDRANLTRGHVINCVSSLEVSMDDYNSGYFNSNPEKKYEIQTMLLSTDKITFTNKYRTFIEILRKKNPAE